MIIELMGQPASGKSRLILSLSQKRRDTDFLLIDGSYNKKNVLNKFFFLLKNLRLLDKKYFRCKTIIKRALADRNYKKRRFFLRQFRLDYILINYAISKSNKGCICFFSENFYNLLAYIFFYNKSNYKNDLFFQLINEMPKRLLKRDAIIQIDASVENNLHFKSLREGKTESQFAIETNFYKDYCLVKDSQFQSLNLLANYVKKIVLFENQYDKLSEDNFSDIVNNLIEKKEII